MIPFDLFADDSGGHWVMIDGQAVHITDKQITHKEIKAAAEQHGLNKNAVWALNAAHKSGKLPTDRHLYHVIHMAKGVQAAEGKATGTVGHNSINAALQHGTLEQLQANAQGHDDAAIQAHAQKLLPHVTMPLKDNPEAAGAPSHAWTHYGGSLYADPTDPDSASPTHSLKPDGLGGYVMGATGEQKDGHPNLASLQTAIANKGMSPLPEGMVQSLSPAEIEVPGHGTLKGTGAQISAQHIEAIGEQMGLPEDVTDDLKHAYSLGILNTDTGLYMVVADAQKAAIAQGKAAPDRDCVLSALKAHIGAANAQAVATKGYTGPYKDLLEDIPKAAPLPAPSATPHDQSAGAPQTAATPQSQSAAPPAATQQPADQQAGASEGSWGAPHAKHPDVHMGTMPGGKGVAAGQMEDLHGGQQYVTQKEGEPPTIHGSPGEMNEALQGMGMPPHAPLQQMQQQHEAASAPEPPPQPEKAPADPSKEDNPAAPDPASAPAAQSPAEHQPGAVGSAQNGGGAPAEPAQPSAEPSAEPAGPAEASSEQTAETQIVSPQPAENGMWPGQGWQTATTANGKKKYFATVNGQQAVLYPPGSHGKSKGWRLELPGASIGIPVGDGAVDKLNKYLVDHGLAPLHANMEAGLHHQDAGAPKGAQIGPTASGKDKLSAAGFELMYHGGYVFESPEVGSVRAYPENPEQDLWSIYQETPEGAFINHGVGPADMALKIAGLSTAGSQTAEHEPSGTPATSEDVASLIKQDGWTQSGYGGQWYSPELPSGGNIEVAKVGNWDKYEVVPPADTGEGIKTFDTLAEAYAHAQDIYQAQSGSGPDPQSIANSSMPGEAPENPPSAPTHGESEPAGALDQGNYVTYGGKQVPVTGEAIDQAAIDAAKGDPALSMTDKGKQALQDAYDSGAIKDQADLAHTLAIATGSQKSGSYGHMTGVSISHGTKYGNVTGVLDEAAKGNHEAVGIMSNLGAHSYMSTAQAQEEKLKNLTSADVMAEKIGPQGGSNTGGVYKGKDGVERYVKLYKDPNQAYSEVISNSLYNALGLHAPASLTFKHGDKVGYASTMIDTKGEIGQIAGKWTKPRCEKMLKGFAADVLLGNRDVVGATADNVKLMHDGNILRVDNGGTILHRAQGDLKTQQDLDSISEWDTFGSSQYKPIFDKLGISSPDGIPDIVDQIHKLSSTISGAGGVGSFVQSACPNMPAADRETYSKVLQTRLDLLNGKAKELLVAKLGPIEGKVHEAATAGFHHGALSAGIGGPGYHFGGDLHPLSHASAAAGLAWLKEGVPGQTPDAYTQEEKNAMHGLQGGTGSFNPQLYGGADPASLNAAGKSIVKGLDSAYKRDASKIKKEVILHRGVPVHGAAEKSKYVNAKPGDIIDWPGYACSSFGTHGALPKDIHVHIICPVGTRAICLNKAHGSMQAFGTLGAEQHSENEMTIDRGYSVRVLKAGKVGSTHHLVVEVIPNDDR